MTQAEIYDKWHRWAYRVCANMWDKDQYRNRALAIGVTFEDAQQTAQMACWRACGAFDESKGAPSTFIAAVVHNALLAAVLPEKHPLAAFGDGGYGDEPIAAEQECRKDHAGKDVRSVDAADMLEFIKGTLGEDDLRTVEAFCACHGNGKDAAKLLGVTKQCVWIRIGRIRRALKLQGIHEFV